MCLLAAGRGGVRAGEYQPPDEPPPFALRWHDLEPAAGWTQFLGTAAQSTHTINTPNQYTHNLPLSNPTTIPGTTIPPPTDKLCSPLFVPRSVPVSLLILCRDSEVPLLRSSPAGHPHRYTACSTSAFSTCLPLLQVEGATPGTGMTGGMTGGMAGGDLRTGEDQGAERAGDFSHPAG